MIGQGRIDEWLLPVECFHRAATGSAIVVEFLLYSLGKELRNRAQPRPVPPIPSIQRFPKDKLSAVGVVAKVKPIINVAPLFGAFSNRNEISRRSTRWRLRSAAPATRQAGCWSRPWYRRADKSLPRDKITCRNTSRSGEGSDVDYDCAKTQNLRRTLVCFRLLGGVAGSKSFGSKPLPNSFLLVTLRAVCYARWTCAIQFNRSEAGTFAAAVVPG